jgi:hypothetical protein
MQKQLKLIVVALCFTSSAFGQVKQTTTEPENNGTELTEEAFTFTEAQLGEDDNVTQNITIVGSNNNVYASQVGYRFSAARFKFRGYNSKYNEIYINGNPANDAERGEFNFSFVGGLNNQTRTVESALPFEDNNFSMPSLGGSNNYNFRPSAMATGSRLSLTGANRNYTVRGMYTYNTGVRPNGWAYSASVTYRWANMETANVEGTFYNALSYFFGAEKIINDKNSLSLVTWGNPTERGAQSASTDEMYWIANNNYYNPNWGYQNGKKRNSRIVNSFTPAALLTWDCKINDDMKLTTSLLGKYAMYSSTRLNYNNATNPAPDYYSLMPSYYYDVWNGSGSDVDMANWKASYDYLSASKANRQLNWDALYFANKSANAQGADAMFYQQAYHDDQLAFSLSSTLTSRLSKNSQLNLGFNLSTNKGMHYQTMKDLLGAKYFHNVNTYAIGEYAENSSEVQYDLNNPNAVVNEGDRFGYDYNVLVNKATAWGGYSVDLSRAHLFLNGRVTGTSIQRDGKMKNGLAPENSYGKSGTARFLDGGGKVGAHITLGAGAALMIGGGYEWKAPTARTAFASPQVNNDFVNDLKLERNLSGEIGFAFSLPWLKANINGYYSRLEDVTEYSMAYSDIAHSFSYISLTGINKEYYGVELGLNFKVTELFSIKTLGTISEAKYINNANVSYMLSNAEPDATTGSLYHKDVCVNKGMREGGTPLAAASIDLSYRYNFWYFDLIGNYYDKIYLYYSPITRYYNDFPDPENTGVHDLSTLPEQAKGKGGFMLDLSVSKSFRLKKRGQLRVNLMVSNLLNNTKICTGGMEQNRRDKDAAGESIRTYSFENSPKKFYANGINGMLNITYLF